MFTTAEREYRFTRGENVETGQGAPSRYGVVVEECPSAAYVVVLFADGTKRTWPTAKLYRAETPAEAVARIAEQVEYEQEWEAREEEARQECLSRRME